MRPRAIQGPYLTRGSVTFLIGALCLLAVKSVVPQDRLDHQSYKLPIISKTLPIENLRTPDVFGDPPSRRWWVAFTHPGPSEFIRLHIILKSRPVRSTWKLRVLQSDGVLTQELSERDFANARTESSGLWSDFIKGNAFRLELADENNPAGLRIDVDRYSYEFRTPGSQSIIPPKNDLLDLGLDFSVTSPYRARGSSVARITFRRLDEEVPCSGVFITRKLFVTNFHCINDESELDSSRLWLNYVTGQQEKVIRVTKLVIAVRDLDFSILEIEPDILDLNMAEFDLSPIQKKDLILIQHPNGDRKKIAIDGCKVKEVNAPSRQFDFIHLCDSDGGSSGSPVMNKNGQVVGLHHAGILSPTPQNLAVKFREIVKRIQLCNPTLYEEIVTQNPTLKLSI